MKTLSAVMFVLIALAAVTPAQAGTVDAEYDYTETCGMYSLYLTQPVAGKTGTFVYAAQTSTDWSEVYGGLSYAASPNLCLSFGAGGQSGTDKTRYGGSIWAGSGKASALWLWEQGGGRWNKLVLKYQATDTIAVGYVQKTYAGDGIYAEIAFPQSIKVKINGFTEPQIGVVKSFDFNF